MEKSAASARSRMREQNILALTPDVANALRNTFVCTHVVLLDEAERESVFSWPPRHEHKKPSRLDTQRMHVSGLPDPCRKKMAREHEFLSPTTRAVTTETFLVTGRDDGSPQVRRMHAASASSM